MTAYKHELKQSTAYDPATYDQDGFDFVDPGMEGEDDGDYSRGGLLRGTTRIAFNDTKQPKWFIAQSKQPIPTSAKLVVYRIKRAVVKWGRDPLTGKGVLLEQQEVPPGAKWPNINKWNEDTPKSEWRPDIFNPKGDPKGPWERQHIIFFIDMGTPQFDKYSWPTNVLTVGASICVEWIWDKIRDVRGIHGPGVKPMVRAFRHVYADQVRRSRRWQATSGYENPEMDHAVQSTSCAAREQNAALDRRQGAASANTGG